MCEVHVHTHTTLTSPTEFELYIHDGHSGHGICRWIREPIEAQPIGPSKADGALQEVARPNYRRASVSNNKSHFNE